MWRLKTEGSEYLPGLGIRSSVEGQEVVLGSTETVKALGMAVPSDVDLKGRATWIGVNGKVVGAIVIQDEVREYTQGLGKRLHDLDIKRVVLATGDNEEAEARRAADAPKSQLTKGIHNALIIRLNWQGIR